MRSHPSRSPEPERRRLTERDLALLAFAAEHRLVRADHVAVLLGTSARVARARLLGLWRGGFLAREAVFIGRPACFLIARNGLAAIGSRLPVPKLDLNAYSHDIGLGWLWLAARDGAFGELREVMGERQMRSLDGPGRRSDPPLAVRPGGFGPHGGERRHYPDLLLTTASGRRIALELELTGKGRRRLEGIISAYAADPRVDAVLYLVEDRRLGREIQAAARRAGASSLVHVQEVRLPDDARAPGHELARERPHLRASAPDATATKTAAER